MIQKIIRTALAKKIQKLMMRSKHRQKARNKNCKNKKSNLKQSNKHKSIKINKNIKLIKN